MAQENEKMTAKEEQQSTDFSTDSNKAQEENNQDNPLKEEKPMIWGTGSDGGAAGDGGAA